MTIDLGKIAVEKNRDTISGRATGERARAVLDVDADHVRDVIEIVVPEHVKVVTPSFFIGLLEDVVPALVRPEAVRILGANTDTKLNLDHALNTIATTASPFGDLLRTRRSTFRKLFS